MVLPLGNSGHSQKLEVFNREGMRNTHPKFNSSPLKNLLLKDYFPNGFR